MRNPRLMMVILWLVALTPMASAQVVGDSTENPSPEVLLTEMGCTYCHPHPSLQSSLRTLTPDLSQAGLRYQTAYLFEFLQNPGRVRHHLGRARMPSFHLTQGEALALALFLSEQKRETQSLADIPETGRALLQQPPREMTLDPFRSVLEGGELLCLNCHQWRGQGGSVGVEMAETGHRLQPAWMKRYLVDPSAYGVAPGLMPAQFYARQESAEAMQEITKDAAAKIQTIVDHLYQAGAPQRQAQEARWDEARAQFGEVTAVDGEKLFRALNCVACHRHATIQPTTHAVAPEMTQLGRGTLADWLTHYLTHPAAIRPFGYQPGQGGRMPDFRLSKDEVEVLSSYFLKANSTVGNDATLRSTGNLSAFSMVKAETLLQEKLSCLGCHAWKGQGGRMAPDLTGVRHRLTPQRIEQIIRDPRQAIPHSIMPRIPMTDATARLITGLLLQTTAASPHQGYLSPLHSALIPQDGKASEEGSTRTTPQTYARYCAGCHGENGRGDGFNAAFLPVVPTAHADAELMARRPDDTLFDGVYAGGAILNKSHRMPAWGETLTTGEIKELVAYVRTLCDCQGPEWSREVRTP